MCLSDKLADMKNDVNFRLDGLKSALLGIGTSAHDKTKSLGWEVTRIEPQYATNIWEASDVMARIIELPANEMMRKGWELKCDDKVLCEKVEDKFSEIGGLPAFLQALKLDRCHGGSVILMGVDDGQKPDQPLIHEKIKRLEWLNVLEITQIQPASQYTDPMAPAFGKPKTYRISSLGNSLEVHESRLIVFDGIRTSEVTGQGASTRWGASILQRCLDAVQVYTLGYASMGILMADFSVPYLKIKGLAAAMAADGDDMLKQRAKMAELSRSTARLLILDSEEEYGRQTANVTGLADLLDRSVQRLSAASEMPVTLLNGESPSGLNASGDINLRLFYDKISSLQIDKLKPGLTKLVKCLFYALGAKEPKAWELEFCPLYQPTAQETETTRLVTAQRDAAYIQSGVLSPDEVRESRFGGDAYSADTHILDTMPVAPEPELEPENPKAGYALAGEPEDEAPAEPVEVKAG